MFLSLSLQRSCRRGASLPTQTIPRRCLHRGKVYGPHHYADVDSKRQRYTDKNTWNQEPERASRAIFDAEYMGDPEEVPEFEGVEDIIVDSPLEINPKFHFELREVAPCPSGFKRHTSILRDDGLIWVFNPNYLNFEFFDPENECWVEKEVPELPFYRKVINKRHVHVQLETLGNNYFVLWMREDKSQAGTIYCFDKDFVGYEELTSHVPAEPYVTTHARLFTTDNNVFLQTRYRPVRDTVATLYQQPGSDSEYFDKIFVTGKGWIYSAESIFSNLFIYHHDSDSFYPMRLSGSLPCCYAYTPLKNGEVLFLSRLNQGYKVNTETGKVDPLGSIGRPSNLSVGSSLCYNEKRNIVLSVGGGWSAWTNFVVPTPGKSRSKKQFTIKEPGITRKFSNRLLVFDMKTKKWCLPFVEGDTKAWSAVAFATVTAYKDKYIIIGGENSKGETQKVWVLERLPPISHEEMLRRQEAAQEEDDLEYDDFLESSLELPR